MNWYLKDKKDAVSQTETHKKDAKYKPCNMPWIMHCIDLKCCCNILVH